MVRLDAVEADPLGADRAPLHHFVVLPRAGKPYELCTADSSGGRWAAGVHTAPALHGWVLVIDSRKSGGGAVQCRWPMIRLAIVIDHHAARLTVRPGHSVPCCDDRVRRCRTGW